MTSIIQVVYSLDADVIHAFPVELSELHDTARDGFLCERIEMTFSAYPAVSTSSISVKWGVYSTEQDALSLVNTLSSDSCVDYSSFFLGNGGLLDNHHERRFDYPLQIIKDVGWIGIWSAAAQDVSVLFTGSYNKPAENILALSAFGVISRVGLTV